MIWFITFLAIILDNLFSIYSKSLFNNITFFYPMLTLTMLIISRPYLKNHNYLKYSFFIGLIYDILYSSLFLYNALIFLGIAKLIRTFYKNINDNIITKFILVILVIVIYDSSYFFIVYLSHYNIVTLTDLAYKISHSLILNLFFVFFADRFLKVYYKKKACILS